MSSTSAYDDSAAQVRRPTSAIRRDDRELIRTATLAASSHNTQPWTFSVTPDAIVVHADLDRRCPVVDPDDAHLYKSLGCAAENMVQAAVTQGIAATVTVDAARGEVTVNLEKDTTPEPNALSNAIFRRQCTRAAYDGTALRGGGDPPPREAPAPTPGRSTDHPGPREPTEARASIEPVGAEAADDRLRPHDELDGGADEPVVAPDALPWHVRAKVRARRFLTGR